jgi:hypothetical protein
MHLVELYKLEAAGGPILERYRALTAAADMSAADGPAAMAKAEFERQWAEDSAAVTAAVAKAADI